MSKKVYLAGPMSNLPYFNFPAFFKSEAQLVEMGFKIDDIFSPAQHDIQVYGDFWKFCPTGSHDEMVANKEGKIPTYRECLRVDLNWILDNADVIALMPGWEQSKGARCEKALADCLQLEVIYL